MATPTAISSIRNIRDLAIENQAVFLRLDLNVPLSDPDSEGVRHVEDDNRIRGALPTVRHAIERRAKVIIASHLGRPKGAPAPEYSLEPVATRLAELLGQDVLLLDDCVGDGIELMVRKASPGQVLMLENLRFHGGEEANDPAFCHQLARLADIYVADAFGTAHRKHASTYGLPKIVPQKGIGFLIEKELKFLDQLLHKPEKPFFLLLGGAKVADKIKTISTLMRHVDGIAIGGAMAYAFLAAKGESLPEGAMQPTEDGIQAAKKILSQATAKDLPVLLTEDSIDGNDIGPKTLDRFTEFLSQARTIFWNGPVGWFENPKYSHGTFELAKRLAALAGAKIVGGGDTVSAVEQAGVADQYDHLSTGGGAVLKYLEGEGLPGIDVLKSYPKQQK